MNFATGTTLAAPPHQTESQKKERSPLAQLLHALNQPLTGLQCSMEVALASPRTVQQYAQGLREGLELTERMRMLVEAIRDVTDLQEEYPRDAGVQEQAGSIQASEQKATDLRGILLEASEDLRPVAETCGVRIELEFIPGSELIARAIPATARAILFRLLESAVALAEAQTALTIRVASEGTEIHLQVCWQGRRQELQSVLSRAEIGMLAVQAQWELSGGFWERRAIATGELLTLRIRGSASMLGN